MNLSRSITIFLVVSLLTACMTAPGKVNPAVTYDFGMPATRTANEDAWTRVVLDVRSPAWLDSTDINYRLDYDDPLIRRAYSGSRWSGTPAALLAQRLRQQLGMASINGTVSANCLMRIDLQEFSQVFEIPQRSRAVLQVSLTLTDDKRRLVAERQWIIEKSAATPDARSGVHALVEASSELGRQLAIWINGPEAGSALKTCKQTQ